MVSTSALIATSIICLLVGLGLGMLILRAFQGAKPKDIEAKYNTLQNEFNQYQQNVAQHFVDTSQMVSEAEKRHRELREHLVSGALQLTSAEISRAILSNCDDHFTADNKTILENLDPANLAPPQDWAPKTPGQEGVLSEEFGLKEQDDDDESIEVKTATSKKSDV